MDMTEEGGFSFKDALAELVFLAIEANQARRACASTPTFWR